MQINTFRRARNRLAVLGLLAGIGTFSIAVTNEATAPSAAAESVTVTVTVPAPVPVTVTAGVVAAAGVFGWD